MIEEDTVIKIAERFFEREKIKPIRQKTGVDFIFQGKAIDVKGSDSKFNYALSQFLDYTLKYAGLMLIFPTDFLSSPSRLFKFHLLCNLASSLAHKSMEVVLVSEDDKFYYLKKFSSGHILLNDITYQIAYHIVDEKRRMKEILENLNSNIQKACSEIVEDTPDMIIPKSFVK
ncbi:MAG: hypothetical protein AOA66_0756 [Candidatus Bathyarchaeota archaeon BA2]|nr:MAG: hypothetical protein AOA66_0756 [Candidatus Bathyarchaeota archaeon BA2]